MSAEDANPGFWYALFHSGWGIALISTTWAAILRTAIGRYDQYQKRAQARERALVQKIAEMEGDIRELKERAKIEDCKK